MKKIMTEAFFNLRITKVLFVFLALVIIQYVDGYPYQWSEFLSYGNGRESMTGKETPKEGDRVASASRHHEKGTVVSGETVNYSTSFVVYNGEKVESRIINKSQDEQWTELDNDEDDENENYDEVKSDDENDEKYNDTDSKNGDSDDEITQLIEQALRDEIFLTQEKWAATLFDKQFDVSDDEKTSVKVQRPRSPGDPPIGATELGNSTTNDRIIFPDDAADKKSDDVRKRPVPSCENSTFCLNPPYYPSDSEVQTALKARYLDPITEPPSISERIGPMDDENGLCISREQIIQPKTALDDNNEWHYILNNELYVQTVRVEICQTRDSACQIIEDIASGYKTSCKQKFIYRQLVALGENGTASIPFQIPSSCCCHVKFTGDPLLRIAGFTKRKQQSPVESEENEK